MSPVFPITPDARFRLYTATEGQTVFSVPFPWQNNVDIEVWRYPLVGDPFVLAEAEHYQLTGAGNPGGGTLTLNEEVAAIAGEQLLMLGSAQLTRIASIVQGGRFRSRGTDDDFDRQILIAQEVYRELGRTLKTAYGVSGAEVEVGADNELAVWIGGRLVPGPIWGDDLGIPGQGIPAGGAAGQWLRKASSADYHAEWSAPLTAAQIPYTPGGGLAATYVQQAIDELDAEKQPLDLDLSALAAAFSRSSSSGPASLAFAEDTDNGSSAVTLKAPTALAGNIDVVLPSVASTLLSYGTSLDLELTSGAFTHSDGLYNASFRNSASDGNDIYAPIFPSIDHYDAVQGVTVIANGSTIEHATGLAGYVSNDDATTSGVALFGAAMATRDSAKVWGINTLLMDAATRTAGTATGRLLYNELDFNVMNPDTKIIGMSLGGNSLAQPDSAVGFVVNTLSQTYGYKWTTGFYSLDGAATYGLALGALAASGANIDSQPILLQYFNGSAAKKSLTIFAESNALSISNDDADLTLTVTGYINVPSSKGYAVNSDLVVGTRKTGWGGPTGTPTRTTFATGSVTLPQLAERVKALIDDLTTHGLIGA